MRSSTNAVLACQLVDNLVSFYSMDVGFQGTGAAEGDLIVWERFVDPKTIALSQPHHHLWDEFPEHSARWSHDRGGAAFAVSRRPVRSVDGADCRLGAEGGRFLVAGLDYNGPAPDGVQLIRSDTGIAAFFARGLVIKGDVQAATQTVMNRRVYPLSKQANPPKTKIVKATGVAIDTISPPDPEDYRQRAAKALQTPSTHITTEPPRSPNADESASVTERPT
jgi:hypothetical protein